MNCLKEDLTEDDCLLLKLLARNASNPYIGELTGLSKKGVSVRLKQLYLKLGLDHRNPRVAAGCLAVNLGLIKP